jgi:glycosyltransferase involved in cell wall biosynthesis
MMDIAFLITSLERGGAETQLVRIALSLRRRGWEVGILTMLPSSAFIEEIRDAGIPLVECISAPNRLPWRMIPTMTRQLRRWRPPILVTFNFPADVMGRICGRLAGVPKIIGSLRTAHVKTSFRKMFYRFTEPLIALTVSNSTAAVTYMVSRRILTPQKTHVIPNGLLASNYPSSVPPAEVRAELGIPSESFLWLAVGNLRLAKDYPTLLEAASLCVRKFPRFRLCVIGGGEEWSVLQTDVEARRLQDVVQFLGPRADVPRLLAAGDAYVLSSAWEGMPNTVMEAMASALPVVATDVGGVCELVEEGISGFIVPPRNPVRLAEQMGSIMAMPAEARRKMGMSGRERMVTQFDIERVVDKWVEVFQGKVLGQLGTRKVWAGREDGS